MKSFGCAHNTSDGEYICGLLADAGYRLTKDMEMVSCASSVFDVHRRMHVYS